jgi:hypothetical protein
MSTTAKLQTALQRAIEDEFCSAIGWHKLTFPLQSHELVKTVVHTALLALEIDKTARHPNGFAIFSGWDFGNDYESTSFVLYFSPVASLLCANALPPKSLTTCEKPDPQEGGLALAYAGLHGLRLWELLK